MYLVEYISTRFLVISRQTTPHTQVCRVGVHNNQGVPCNTHTHTHTTVGLYLQSNTGSGVVIAIREASVAGFFPAAGVTYCVFDLYSKLQLQEIRKAGKNMLYSY